MRTDYTYAQWLSNGAATVYHGPPFDSEPGLMSADFTVTPTHEVVLKAYNEYDWDPFVIPVVIGENSSLSGSVPMPSWGDGKDVMRLIMQVRSTSNEGVAQAYVDVHDDYGAFSYGGKETEKSTAYRVGPAGKICGALPGSWAGVALHGTISTIEVWLKFVLAPGDTVKIEARYRDVGGSYDFNPDHPIAPSPAGTFEWKTGTWPVYKNLGEITAISCNSSGRVDGVHVKGVTFPDFGFEGII
ncbi:hypothetical protein AB0L71_08705 [Streptomyces sp. NPDC052052]|uniref:hypothetical protein n=1 Tax=Streptomyces sp. NPDC052052 TaxID=3154756 RepID=UPI003418DB72